MWDSTFLILTLHLKKAKDTRKFVVVNYYAKPSAQKTSVEQLKLIVNALHKSETEKALIVCGDFNIRPADAIGLQQDLHLEIVEPEAGSILESITRT